MASRPVRVESKTRRHRGRRGSSLGPGPIPIPSFSSNSSDSSPAESPTNKSSQTLAPLWNKSCLLRVEGALQVQLLTQRRRKSSPGARKLLLALDEFYALARKQYLAENATQKSTPEWDKYRVGLSREERLLYDLMCAASPSLYRFVETMKGDSSVHEQSGAKKEMIWCLEVVPYTGNRMEELRRLLNKPKVNDSKCKTIMQKIQSHRAKQNTTEMKDEHPKVTNTDRSTGKLALEPYIQPDMNLEERVRARAEARQSRQLESETKQDGSERMDRTSLLRLADALWSHTRHVMNRQSQMESSKLRKRKINKSATTEERSCVMTLKDVVNTFSGSLVLGKHQSTSLHSTKKRTSQREMVDALHELERLVPGWIQLVEAKEEKTGRVSKNATVWIKPIEYQFARMRLAGDESKETMVRISKPPIGKQRSSVTNNKAPTRGPTTPQTPPHHVARVSLTPNSHQATRTQMAATEQVAPPANKKPRTVGSTMKKAPNNRSQTSAPVAGKKRPAEESPRVRTTPKKRRGLRINQHLILTDADYSGGEIIEPTGASPRGLKMLFSQLKQGKRI